MRPERRSPAGPGGSRSRSGHGRASARLASNPELLARVLEGIDGTDADTARALLAQFGNLRGLAQASSDDLLHHAVLQPAVARRIEACLELGRRAVYGRSVRRRTVQGPEDVARLLMPCLRDLDREHFVAVLLTTKNQVIEVVTVAIGSLSASLVHPREVLKPAIQASAAALVVAHNHPTGVPDPSREDLEFTRRLRRCCDLVGIRLLDHVIVGDGTYESLKEGGHL